MSSFCKSYSHFYSKNTCELDLVLTRMVNILTTNELVKLTRLWRTGSRCFFQILGHVLSGYHFSKAISSHSINFQEEMMVMAWYFTSLSTLFKSYRDDGRVIMKGSVEWIAIQSWAEFCLLEHRTSWSEVKNTHHSAIGRLQHSPLSHPEASVLTTQPSGGSTLASQPSGGFNARHSAIQRLQRSPLSHLEATTLTTQPSGSFNTHHSAIRRLQCSPLSHPEASALNHSAIRRLHCSPLSHPEASMLTSQQSGGFNAHHSAIRRLQRSPLSHRKSTTPTTQPSGGFNAHHAAIRRLQCSLLSHPEASALTVQPSRGFSAHHSAIWRLQRSPLSHPEASMLTTQPSRGFNTYHSAIWRLPWYFWFSGKSLIIMPVLLCRACF